jgi:hypothetical protein
MIPMCKKRLGTKRKWSKHGVIRVNSKWYEELGKFQRLPNELSDLPSVNTCQRHKENKAYNVIY